MLKARKYVVKKYSDGLPKRNDFEVVETELPPIENGEVLVKTKWVSVDPYQRARNSLFPLPYDQYGFQIGVVEDSKEPRFPVGTKIVSHNGWCDYFVTNPSMPDADQVKPYKLPDLRGLPESYGLGAVGMPGATAYLGFLEICQPKEGETVVVTGAAGAIGSLVGQIAKLKGCRVIGFAGADHKVQWLENDLGFDRAFNYKNVDIDEALKDAAPNGVDCYFDNVGGEISSMIIRNMNTYGRICACGSISSYNAKMTDMPKATVLQPYFIFKELKMEGFIIYQRFERWPEAFKNLVEWILNDQIKVKEHVTVGFNNIYDSFIGMLVGENTGKAVVKIQ